MYSVIFVIIIVLIVLLNQIAKLKSDVAALSAKVDRMKPRPLTYTPIASKEDKKEDTSLSSPASPASPAFAVKPLVPSAPTPAQVQASVAPSPAAVLLPPIRVEEKPVVNPPAPRPALPEAMTKKKVEAKETKDQSSAFNFEKLFMGNLFNKLGALALIVGVAIFIKLISPLFVFTPLKQIITAYVLGLGLTITAWRIHRKQMKGFAEVLMGTGFAVFFVATYGATSYYQMMPDYLALIIASTLVVSSYLIAHRFHAFSTMLIGMLGAYLNPLLIGHYQSIEFLYIYFIFINIITAVYTYINKSKLLLNYVNILLTSIFIYAYSVYKEPISFVFPAMLWAVYMIYDVVSIKKMPLYKPLNRGLSVLNYLVLLLFSFSLFGLDEPLFMGLILLSVATIYGGLAFWYSRGSKARCLLYYTGCMLALLFAPYFIENETLRVSTWALQGLACGLIAQKWRWVYMERWCCAFLLLSCAAALIVAPVGEALSPFWNERMIQLGLPCLCALGSAFLLKKVQDSLSSFLLFASLSMGFALLSIEVHALLGQQQEALSAMHHAMVYILIALSYVPLAMRLYQTTKFKLFAVTGYAVYILSSLALLVLAVVLAYDLNLWPILNIRFLAFVAAIGVTLFLSRDALKKGLNDVGHFFKFVAFNLAYYLLGLELYVVMDVAQMSARMNMAMIYLLAGMSYAPLAMRMYKSTQYKLFEAIGYAVYGLATVALCDCAFALAEGLSLWPILNMRFVGFVATIGVTLFLSHDALQRGLSSRGHFFKFVAFNLAYYLLGLELYVAMDVAQMPEGMNMAMIYLLAGMSYAPLAMRLYTPTRFLLFRLASTLSYGLSLLGLVCCTCAYSLDYEFWCILNMRFLAFMGMMAVTLFLSRDALQKGLKSDGYFLQLIALNVGAVLFYLEYANLLEWVGVKHVVTATVLYLLPCFAYVSCAIRLYRASSFKLFAVAAYGVYTLALLYLLGFRLFILQEGELAPLFNMTVLALAAAIAVSLDLARGACRNFFHYVAIALGFYTVGVESYEAGAHLEELMKACCVSIAWIVYSTVLMAVGIFKESKTLKYAGIWIVIFTACKIVFYDLSSLDALSKTIAFLLLGAALLTISYYYTKKISK